MDENEVEFSGVSSRRWAKVHSLLRAQVQSLRKSCGTRRAQCHLMLQLSGRRRRT